MGDAVRQGMTVLVPFTARHVDTLAGAPPDAEWVYVGETAHSYWECLSEYWERGEDLVIIEHDVVCRPDVSQAFASCLEPWCIFPYDNHDAAEAEAWRNMLGCTRFRRELVRAVPDAVSSIEPQHRDYHNVCDGIGNHLRAHGATHHWHSPAVVHHRMAIGHLAIRG
jgi:hypothetical protein